MDPFKNVIFGCLFTLLMVACAPKNDGEGKVKILATTAQVGDMVSYIGGDRIEHKILIRGDLDPHSYEIVKGDAEKLDHADLIFYNGLGLEHGASLFSILQNSPKAIAIGETIAQDKILKKGALIDPHVWMDISLWRQGVDPIVESLTRIDPEGGPFYKQRGEQLKAEMLLTHLNLRNILQSIPSNKRYLVTSHDAFHYFTRGYLADEGELDWQARFAAPEGLAPEGQLSGRDIQKIIDYLKDKKITVIFPESNVSKDSLRKIATAGRELGLEITICQEPLYGDSMSGKKYLDAMLQNGKTIERHLSK